MKDIVFESRMGGRSAQSCKERANEASSEKYRSCDVDSFVSCDVLDTSKSPYNLCVSQAVELNVPKKPALISVQHLNGHEISNIPKSIHLIHHSHDKLDGIAKRREYMEFAHL